MAEVALRQWTTSVLIERFRAGWKPDSPWDFATQGFRMTVHFLLMFTG
jgi:hypothetical protein